MIQWLSAMSFHDFAYKIRLSSFSKQLFDFFFQMKAIPAYHLLKHSDIAFESIVGLLTFYLDTCFQRRSPRLLDCRSSFIYRSKRTWVAVRAGLVFLFLLTLCEIVAFSWVIVVNAVILTLKRIKFVQQHWKLWQNEIVDLKIYWFKSLCHP